MEFLNIDEILPNPFQPRKEFDMEQLAQLAKSIKEYGIIEPLIVRINDNDEFELIAGERRLRAAKMAGLDKVPIILKDYDDDKVAQIALIENLQRSNLNVIEEANAYQLLLHKFNLKQEEVAQKVGKSRSHIANFVRLLNLAKEVQCLLQDNKLNMGQAKPLLAIEDEKLQVKLANLIIERELSARKAEALVKKVLAGDNVIEQIEQVKKAKMYLNDVQERLKQILGTNVNIKQGKKKSRIEIEFYNDDDLARLVELLMEKQESPQMNKSRIIKDFNI